MVVQVGDKVLVYGAGTPWAFAKKIEPVEVGDKVDVVTLSDGTKLAMPKIELDLSEYVWVVPEFDTPFNIGDVPFGWSMMPLGAAVFTITDIIDCWHVEDSEREWGDDFSLSGCLMIILNGENKRLQYIIGSHSGATIYTLTLNSSFPEPGYADWSVSTYSVPGNSVAIVINNGICDVYCQSTRMYFATAWISSPDFVISGADTVTIPLKMVNSDPPYTQCTMGGGFSYNLNNALVRADSVFSADELVAYGLSGGSYINPDYPDYTNLTINYSLYYSGRISIFVNCNNLGDGTVVDMQVGPLSFQESDCVTDGLSAGDKYVIYNPSTGRLVFNDATKTVISSASWREISYSGEIVTLSPVEYVWDGQGHVYLSQSKTTLSTIFYDNEVRVEAFGDTGDVRAIDFHTNDEFTYSGETVSRELVNITSILRAGKNYVQLKARDTGGKKVGFPTPIYIKRDMS